MPDRMTRTGMRQAKTVCSVLLLLRLERTCSGDEGPGAAGALREKELGRTCSDKTEDARDSRNRAGSIRGEDKLHGDSDAAALNCDNGSQSLSYIVSEHEVSSPV